MSERVHLQRRDSTATARKPTRLNWLDVLRLVAAIPVGILFGALAGRIMAAIVQTSDFGPFAWYWAQFVQDGFEVYCSIGMAAAIAVRWRMVFAGIVASLQTTVWILGTIYNPRDPSTLLNVSFCVVVVVASALAIASAAKLASENNK